MGVNHPGLIPRPILWLCLVKFSPNELIGSLRLALEPLEVLKMIHDVACLNLLLKNVSLVKEKNKGCMVQPGVKLDLSEQLNRLFKSVESLAIFSLQVRVVFIDSREEDYTCHTLREKVNPVFSLCSLAPDVRYFKIAIAHNKLVLDDSNCALPDTNDIISGGQVSINVDTFKIIKETV